MDMFVSAAGVNRIFDWNSKVDSGTISAFRTYDAKLFQTYGLKGVEALSDPDSPMFDPEELEHYRVTRAVNMKNTKLLAMKIRAMGYGYIAIDGVYRESGTGKESREKSFFVFDYQQKGGLKKALLKLGNEFFQDSITYADAGGDYNLYMTSPFSLEPNQPLHGPSGKIDMRFSGRSANLTDSLTEEQFYSKIRNRPFFWKNFVAQDAEDEVTSALKVSNVYNASTRGLFAQRVLAASPFTIFDDDAECADITPLTTFNYAEC